MGKSNHDRTAYTVPALVTVLEGRLKKVGEHNKQGDKDYVYRPDMVRDYLGAASMKMQPGTSEAFRRSGAHRAEVVESPGNILSRVASFAGLGIAAMIVLVGSNSIESRQDNVTPRDHTELVIAPGAEPLSPQQN